MWLAVLVSYLLIQSMGLAVLYWLAEGVAGWGAAWEGLAPEQRGLRWTRRRGLWTVTEPWAGTQRALEGNSSSCSGQGHGSKLNHSLQVLRHPAKAVLPQRSRADLPQRENVTDLWARPSQGTASRWGGTVSPATNHTACSCNGCFGVGDVQDLKDAWVAVVSEVSGYLGRRGCTKVLYCDIPNQNLK